MYVIVQNVHDLQSKVLADSTTCPRFALKMFYRPSDL